VVVQEKEVTTKRLRGGAVIAFGISEILSQINHPGGGPILHQRTGKTMGVVRRGVVRHNNLDLFGKSLLTERTEAAFEPLRSVIVEDNYAQERNLTALFSDLEAPSPYPFVLAGKDATRDQAE